MLYDAKMEMKEKRAQLLDSMRQMPDYSLQVGAIISVGAGVVENGVRMCCTVMWGPSCNTQVNAWHRCSNIHYAFAQSSNKTHQLCRCILKIHLLACS